MLVSPRVNLSNCLVLNRITKEHAMHKKSKEGEEKGGYIFTCEKQATLLTQP